MATCKLGVEVVSAHDLKRQDGQGISPYVVLRFDRQHFRTATKQNDLNPVWNERFYFDVSDPSNLPELFLKATIHHDARSTNDWRGTTKIRGTSFVPLPDAVVLPYPLEKLGKLGRITGELPRITGELRLKVYITDEASIRASDPLPATGSVIESILRGESSPHGIPFQCLKEIANNFSVDQVLGQGGSGVVYKTESTLCSVPLQHLKDITNNFCDERKIGTGGFGMVYKGVTANGKVIAVKKFVQSILSSHEQFENEVNLLRKLEHTNIVRLVGFCYETQSIQKRHEGKYIIAWEIECLLCLEYFPKGSLNKYISDASSGLDWPTRLKIIEGVSYGLQYLHEQSDGPIIHLDLKPGNILLDENMIPKITDFGLSRFFDKEQTIHTVITCGTLGYMSPEYLRGIITPMSDIFSLGVLIMEIITGHRDYPNDIRTSSMEFIELELQEWRNVLQKELGYRSLEICCQQIKKCIQIGLLCVNPERTRRPTMKEIINMLEGLESMNWYISNELTSLSVDTT